MITTWVWDYITANALELIGLFMLAGILWRIGRIMVLIESSELSKARARHCQRRSDEMKAKMRKPVGDRPHRNTKQKELI